LRGEAGFGLIEMTIALMILAIGISALGGLFVSGNLALRRASKQDTATVLADRALEQFRAIKFNDIALNDSLVASAMRDDATYANDSALSRGTTDNHDVELTVLRWRRLDADHLLPHAYRLGELRHRDGNVSVHGSGQTSPDGHTYRIDTYVTLGCPTGTRRAAPAMPSSR
jgi:prepilin-type N-terminal cleavage/methylation domain-containing protein